MYWNTIRARLRVLRNLTVKITFYYFIKITLLGKSTSGPLIYVWEALFKDEQITTVNTKATATTHKGAW